VHYTYGPAGAAHNRVGRIESQEDARGGQEFFYGPLGEEVKNVRTIMEQINQFPQVRDGINMSFAKAAIQKAKG
jgi:hypothetical protein